MPIYFHTEDVSFRIKNPARLRSWIKKVIDSHSRKTGIINFILCSDEYLLELNRQYLKHDYYTDIITFSQSDDINKISADIYISVDRIKENAMQGTQCSALDSRHLTRNELHRVMIHGILHLLGYDDKSASLKKKMREKEESCLKML